MRHRPCYFTAIARGFRHLMLGEDFNSNFAHTSGLTPSIACGRRDLARKFKNIQNLEKKKVARRRRHARPAIPEKFMDCWFNRCARRVDALARKNPLAFDGNPDFRLVLFRSHDKGTLSAFARPAEAVNFPESMDSAPGRQRARLDWSTGRTS